MRLKIILLALLLVLGFFATDRLGIIKKRNANSIEELYDTAKRHLAEDKYEQAYGGFREVLRLVIQKEGSMSGAAASTELMLGNTAMKQKLIEMSRLFSMQTNGQEINRSDIVIGLILALYEVKDQVTVGVLPTRGKWGAPTASQIGPALTLAFQEALSSNSAEDPFKKLGTAVNS